MSSLEQLGQGRSSPGRRAEAFVRVMVSIRKSKPNCFSVPYVTSCWRGASLGPFLLRLGVEDVAPRSGRTLRGPALAAIRIPLGEVLVRSRDMHTPPIEPPRTIGTESGERLPSPVCISAMRAGHHQRPRICTR